MDKHSDTIGKQPSHLDFISSIVLFLLSIFIVTESIGINGEVGGPLFSSPGLLPLFLGTMLMLCSVLLFVRSMKQSGFAGNIDDLKMWLQQNAKSSETRNMLLGIAILALFTFFLLPRLPFLLASFIFLFVLMKVMNAGSVRKIVLTSVIVSAAVYTLFEIIFKVPLP